MMRNGLQIQLVDTDLCIREPPQFAKPAVVIDVSVSQKDVGQVGWFEARTCQTREEILLGGLRTGASIDQDAIIIFLDCIYICPKVWKNFQRQPVNFCSRRSFENSEGQGIAHFNKPLSNKFEY